MGVLVISELLWTQLAESYLRSRDAQCFRGQHADEYFFIVKASTGPCICTSPTLQTDVR